VDRVRERASGHRARGGGETTPPEANPVGARRPFEPRALIGALQDAEVDYVAIDGVAAIAHGAQRITRDLGIVIEPTVENAERLLRALVELGAEVCAPPRRRFPLEAGADPPWLLGQDRFFDTTAGGLDVRHSPPGAPPYETLRAGAAREELPDGLKLTVAGRDHLEAMKRASGRDKDLRDLAELRELERYRKGPELER